LQSGLFNDAVITSEYSVEQFGDWRMNWRNFGRNLAWNSQDIVQEFVWRDWGKPRNISGRITDALVEI
jgi:hypothetical protein